MKEQTSITDQISFVLIATDEKETKICTSEIIQDSCQVSNEPFDYSLYPELPLLRPKRLR